MYFKIRKITSSTVNSTSSSPFESFVVRVLTVIGHLNYFPGHSQFHHADVGKVS